MVNTVRGWGILMHGLIQALNDGVKNICLSIFLHCILCEYSILKQALSTCGRDGPQQFRA